jgi:hypothetical protein
MALHLLLDEHISPVVADQVKRHRPEIVIESVHRWRDGAFVSQKDEQLLLAAAYEGLTLVTYDRRTIPSLLDRFAEEGKHHAGVIYVDQLTVASRNFGLLLKAITEFWEENQVPDWKDHVDFLRKPKR